MIISTIGFHIVAGSVKFRVFELFEFLSSKELATLVVVSALR